VTMSGEVVPELSVVILCYQAEEFIPQCLASVEAEMQRLGVPYEIILVANYITGSKDRSPEIALGMMKTNPRVKVVAKPKEGMMGWDMRSGLEAASGRVLALIDGDGQTNPSDIGRVYHELCGRRLDLCQAFRVERRDGWQRTLISRVYNGVFHLLFPGTELHDVNGKPKMMTRQAYQQLRLKSTGWVTDAEIIIEARRNSWRIGEIPTVFGKRAVGRSSINIGAILEFIQYLLVYRIRGTRWGRRCQ